MQQPTRSGAATSTANRKQPASAIGPASKYLNVGAFRFWFVGQRWEWSDEVAGMHGYEPGTVVPTTKLLLSHKHPDDRAHVQDLLDYALQSAGSFSSRHRFIDTAGEVHDAIVVADRMLDEAGAVVGTAGYYIDLTTTFDETRHETRQEVLDEALPDLFENRAAIEQAKGVLMYVYRVRAEQAFRVLRWRSQETDLQSMTFFGSATLNAVLDCHGEGEETSTSVRLVADHGHVLRPIQVTEPDRILEVYPTLSDAPHHTQQRTRCRRT